MGLDNENPTLFDKSEERKLSEKDYDDDETDEFDSREIFGKQFKLNYKTSLICFEKLFYLLKSNILDLIRGITDPEHPLSLEELRVVDQNLIEVNKI